MSIFSTFFSSVDKWREEPSRVEQPPPTCNKEIQSINKTERIKADGLEGITISARTNVIISTNQGDEIVARIHGMATSNYTLDAYIIQIEKSIQIKAKGYTNPSNDVELKKTEKHGKGETRIADHSFANITLEVEIPEKSNIKWIKIKNTNGDIICKSVINVESLEVINENGNIQIGSTFSRLSITSRVGNISVKTAAISDMFVEIENSDGSALLCIENIGQVRVNYQLDGASLINPRYSGEYTLSGKIYISKGSFVYT